MNAISTSNPASPVRIGIAVNEEGSRVSGHAGQAKHWVIFECEPGGPLPAPRRITLTKEQLPHHWQDDGPHPLQDMNFIVAASAGDGFIRHMAKWGADVLLTGETDPHEVRARIRDGEALPDTRFDVTTTLCKLRDLFSRH